MFEWYLDTPQPTFNSGFENDDFDDYVQDGFEELLTETKLGKDIFLCKGVFDGEKFEVETPTKGIIQSETPDAYTQGWKRQLLARIGEISDYKYVRYDGYIWVIITEPFDNCIYDKCVIHMCNYVLKWQTASKKIVYYPACIENASQYNTGEEGDKTITLGYNQLMAYISMDEISVTIDRELRLFVDYNTTNPLPYKVTRPDTVCFSYGKGRAMSIVLTENQFNPETDSIENWLCDYFPASAETITIVYSGNPTIRIGGQKTLRVDTDKSVIWSVESEIGATITPDGNSVKVKCPSGDFVEQTITVKAEVNGVVGECVLTVTGGV